MEDAASDMDDDRGVKFVERVRLREPESVRQWVKRATLLAAFEAIGRSGAVCTVKIDGERGPGDSGRFTVLITGGKLRGDYFRRDGDDLDSLLRDGIEFIAERDA